MASLCIAGCFLEYLAKAAAGRLSATNKSDVLHRWSARLLRSIHVRLTIEGEPPGHGLIVSNHLSYLDILVFSAAAPCAFVSKYEIRSWPIVGRIASLAGCVFIDRADRAQAHDVQPEMRSALGTGSRLVLFPEGTSSDGTQVLPFYSSLLEPAVALRAAITTAHISYSIADGDAASEVCYWGEMKLLPHVVNLFTKERIDATLKFSDRQQFFSSRKQAALMLREEIKRMDPLNVSRP